MRTRQLRALRGAAAAMLAVLFAAVSHTMGGGTAPGIVILLGVSALAWPVTTALVGRGLRPVGLASAVIVTQVALHAVFALTSSSGTSAGALPQNLAAHQHGQVIMDAAGAFAQVVLPTPPMLAAHALAAVVSFLALFGGERMLRAIAAWTLRLLHRAAVAAPGSASVPRATFTVAPAPIARNTRGTPRRRGPPLKWGDALVA
ncbi:hypothetical protein [Microbacterium sp.]|jgi:hypothetical protein|uniref:hypothetical protein n=1 Tax=Microbacterium sp. TaxID=51671 RepID=UPI0037C51E00